MTDLKHVYWFPMGRKIPNRERPDESPLEWEQKCVAYVILEHETELNDLVFDLEHEHENLFLDKCIPCPPEYWLDLVKADLFSETRVELYFEAFLFDEKLLEKAAVGAIGNFAYSCLSEEEPLGPSNPIFGHKVQMHATDETDHLGELMGKFAHLDKNKNEWVALELSPDCLSYLPYVEPKANECEGGAL